MISECIQIYCDQDGRTQVTAHGVLYHCRYLAQLQNADSHSKRPQLPLSPKPSKLPISTVVSRSRLTHTQFCRLWFGRSEQAGQPGQVGQVIFWGVITTLINEYGVFWSKLANLAKLCRGRGGVSEQ